MAVRNNRDSAAAPGSHAPLRAEAAETARVIGPGRVAEIDVTISEVQAWRAVQLALARLAQASTTMVMPLTHSMVNPDPFVPTPKLPSMACTCDLHSSVGRLPNVAPQAVVLNKE